MNQPVPVSVAKDIAERFGKSSVVILCYEPATERTFTTTYGVTPFDKENAAAAGSICAKALGSDLSRKQVFEDFHHDYDAANYKAAVELMQKIVSSRAPANWSIDKLEEFLKQIGKTTP